MKPIFPIMTKPLIVLAALLLALLSGAAGAATRYVGNCGAPNTTTIAAAIAAASAGDTINICPGTYNEYVAVNKALTIKGSTGNAADIKVQRSGNWETPFGLNAANITLKDMTLVATSGGVGAAGSSPGPMVFENLVVSADKYGLFLYGNGAGAVTFKNVAVTATTDWAIYMGGLTGAHTLEGVTAIGGQVGIYAPNGLAKLTNVNAEGKSGSAISMGNLHAATFTDVTAISSGGYAQGIHIGASHATNHPYTFTKVTASGKNRGINIDRSGKVTMANVTATGTGESGIYLNTNADGAHEFDNVTATGNGGITLHRGAASLKNVTATGTSGSAIWMGNKYPATLDTVTASAPNHWGIQIANSDGISNLYSFTNVKVTAKGRGIDIARSGKVTMSGITVNTPDVGIFLDAAAKGGHELTNLDLTAGNGAIIADGAARIEDFKATTGIFIGTAQDVVIRRGLISSPIGMGIQINGADKRKVTVQDVTISTGWQYGFMLMKASEALIQRVCVSGMSTTGIYTNADNVTIRDSQFGNSGTYGGVMIDSASTQKATVTNNAFLKPAPWRAWSNSTKHKFDGNYWQGVAGGTNHTEGNINDKKTLGSNPVKICYAPPPPGGSGGGPGVTGCIPTTVAGVPSPFIAGAGDLQLGKNGKVNGIPIVISGTTSLPVTGTTSALSAGALPALTPATFPAVGTGTLNTTGTVAAGSYGTINASGNPTVFSGGTYYINTLNATGPIQLAAGNYFINRLNLSANLTVTGKVQLFIGNQVDLKNNNISLNAGGNAGNLQVNLYGGAEFDAGKNNISFTGLIYGPGAGAEIKFDNNATITGAIVTAGEIQFGNNATVNYDATVQAQISSIACPASGPDHYELSLPASSITCLPTIVTITACANSSNPCTSVATSVTGTASMATTGGAIGAAALTAGTGTTTLSYPLAVNGTAVTVSLTSATTPAINPATCSGGSCSTTFNTAGFIFSATANGVAATIPTQVAGTPSSTYYLRAVKTNTTTMACQAALTGVQSVNFAYACNNPATCYTANLMSVNGGTAATIARNNNGSVTSYLPVGMTFDANGNAPFTFNYGDVGQVTLHASRAAGGTLLSSLIGSSNVFVVKPGGFVLSGIAPTLNPAGRCAVNPNSAPACAADATGTRFVRAGEAFSATVTAVTSTGSTAYNFGKETTPESVKLASALVAPTGGAPGALGGVFGAFSNGVATGTAFTWNEVGIITLTPSVNDGDYLGAGDTTGTTSGNVGRFYPAQFRLSTGSIVNRADLCPAAAACPAAFTYMGEQMNALFTLTAQTVGGTTTQNYAGAFAKLDPTVFAYLNMGAVDRTTTPAATLPQPPYLLTPRISVTGMPAVSCSTAPCFLAGVATVTAPFMITRNVVAPDGVYTAVDIGIKPEDADTVTVPFDMDITSLAAPLTNDRGRVGTSDLRYGRMKLSNAHGSELLPLPMAATVQYWNGSGYVTSNTDSLTTFANTNVVFSNWQRNINNVNYPNSGATSVTPASVVFTNGVGSFKLSAPGAGKNGSVDLTTNAPGYLPSNTARATFGVYKGSNEFIYLRENY